MRTKKLEGKKERKGNYHRRRKELQHRRETLAYGNWSRRFEHEGLTDRQKVSSREESEIIKTRNQKDFCHHIYHL